MLIKGGKIMQKNALNSHYFKATKHFKNIKMFTKQITFRKKQEFVDLQFSR